MQVCEGGENSEDSTGIAVAKPPKPLAILYYASGKCNACGKARSQRNQSVLLCDNSLPLQEPP
jgi:hypothetical protein